MTGVFLLNTGSTIEEGRLAKGEASSPMTIPGNAPSAR